MPPGRREKRNATLNSPYIHEIYPKHGGIGGDTRHISSSVAPMIVMGRTHRAAANGAKAGASETPRSHKEGLARVGAWLDWQRGGAGV